MSGAIARVVVTLDAASENQTAIETAARLAARAAAPLHGIFVEDEDLQHLAGLPFARQVTHGGGSRPLSREDIDLHLRAAAERARRDLLAAAKRHGVAGSFAIVRGGSPGAFADVGERDLIVAGALTRPVAGHFRIECRWWSSIEVVQGPFLLARRAWGAAGTVAMLLHDRGPAAERLLAAAGHIAAAGGAVLTVVCPPALAAATDFKEWLAERVGAARVRVVVAPEEPVALHDLLVGLDCHLLAVDAGAAEGRIARLRELAQGLACDLLIVR